MLPQNQMYKSTESIRYITALSLIYPKARHFHIHLSLGYIYQSREIIREADSWPVDPVYRWLQPLADRPEALRIAGGRRGLWLWRWLLRPQLRGVPRGRSRARRTPGGRAVHCDAAGRLRLAAYLLKGVHRSFPAGMYRGDVAACSN